MTKKIRISALASALVATLAASAISPSVGQSTPKEKQAQESTGEANSQKQLGGHKRDRRISREIFRSSHNQLVSHARHVHHLQSQIRY